MEEFQALLERIMISIKDCGPIQDQSLTLTEQDIRTYKNWLLHHVHEDCFESLVDWVELSNDNPMHNPTQKNFRRQQSLWTIQCMLMIC